MSDTVRLPSGFSARVDLSLAVGQEVIPLAKIGYRRAVPATRIEIAPGTRAVLIVTIDGRERRWDVVLDEGALPFDEEFAFRMLTYPPEPPLF
jgi:hypothetical protein